MTSDDSGTDMTTFDEELDALLSGAAPAPEAPAWCSDVAVLVRTLQSPARPGELEGEADIVARMRELLALPVDDGDGEAPGTEGDMPRLALVADHPAAVDDPAGDADHPAEDGQENEVHRVGAYAADGDEVVDRRAAERLRSRMGVADLDGYRAKHGDRSYIAKHAAARLEASRYPMARTVGRVVAMKAAAFTTAAVIGVAAAAAATTGIVATVVVPAINDHVRRPPAATVPADKDDAGTTRGEQRSGGGRDDDSPTATCSNVLLTCPPAVSVPTEPGPPAPATGSSTATTTPTATSTPSTTSTTDTTEPEPSTTTTTDTTEPTPPTTEAQPTTFEGGG